jgi:uncharacterized coiled-coil protein SlyX
MYNCGLKVWRRAIIVCVFLPSLLNFWGCKTVEIRPNKDIREKENSSSDLPTSLKPSEGSSSGLPSADQLIRAKLEALEEKQAEQEKTLAAAELMLSEEQQKGQKIFNQAAYISLSMTNTAPKKDYRLEHTEIYVDGKLFAEGGRRNAGLPRKREFYAGPITPGCHEILVKTRSVRLKNDLISRYKVDRTVNQTARQTIIAKSGYRIDLHIEGYEAHNTFVNFYRGPAVRFNRTIRPNFLPKAADLSLEKIFDAGRVYIDYKSDNESHRLIEKTVSIDGMPVLVKEKHDPTNDKGIIFNGPLNEGKHTLSISLIFAENKRIQGSPVYNLKLNFDRDFYVISGQTTIVNLTGIPDDSFTYAQEARYARAESKITSTEDEEFFPKLSCSEIAEKARIEKEALSKNKPHDAQTKAAGE